MIRRPLVGILALACVTTLAVGRPESPTAQLATSVEVVMCVGSSDEAGNCGPKPKATVRRRSSGRGTASGSLGYSWGSAGAQHAGVVRTSRPDIKCPPARSCTARVPHGARVRLTARKNPSYGRHEFDHWEGDCASFGAQAVCILPVDGLMRAVAVFRLTY